MLFPSAVQGRRRKGEKESLGPLARTVGMVQHDRDLSRAKSARLKIRDLLILLCVPKISNCRSRQFGCLIIEKGKRPRSKAVRAKNRSEGLFHKVFLAAACLFRYQSIFIQSSAIDSKTQITLPDKMKKVVGKRKTFFSSLRAALPSKNICVKRYGGHGVFSKFGHNGRADPCEKLIIERAGANVPDLSKCSFSKPF